MCDCSFLATAKSVLQRVNMKGCNINLHLFYSEVPMGIQLLAIMEILTAQLL
jgi:hypothetical protein